MLKGILKKSLPALFAITVVFVFPLGLTACGDTHEHDYICTVNHLTSCTEVGIFVYTCSICGDGYIEYEDAFGHTYDGYEYDETAHWQVCTVCGAVSEKESHMLINGVCTVCGYVC